ncbi:MAG TPA: tetratricopeptide repeat protein [Anaerolineae bacterium]|nr:tetratricopeptide repeat protein [Anaerolineae bacterium]
MSHLSLHLLGPYQVTLDGQPVTEFRSDKVRALLAYLALEADRPHRREALAGLLWPEVPDQTARNNLRLALHRLRQAIGDGDADPPVLNLTPETIQFNSASNAWLDVSVFTGRLAAGDAHGHRRLETCRTCIEQLREAADLYRGDFLQGFFLEESVAFSEWAVVRREGLHRRALEALYHLAEYHRQHGEQERALFYARRQLELEPWREEAHRQVMRSLARSGQHSAALAQYEACRQVLLEELGVKPSEETRALYERIQAARETPRHTRGLPPPPTPFVGREDELAEIAGRLADSDCRLLTLVGLGGIGKTRLALRVAEREESDFLNGVYFVPLASLDTPSSLVTAVASALGFTFSEKGDSNTQLLDYLRGKEMLLILDGFEHIPRGASWVAQVLKSAPAVKVLITSRARLNLPGEWVFELEGLSVPDDPRRGDVDRYGAVQLFLQVARQIKRSVAVTPSDEAAIVRVCNLVAGIPLAIELAAAWMRVLSPGEIAAEIERGLDFLSESPAGAFGLQRSMRAVFEQSWRLLSGAEQEAFRRLSVFRSGFTREAAEQVAGVSLPTLASLVDHSLVRREQPDRYAIHELLRQYTAEKLSEQSADAEQLLDRHSRHYAALVQAQEKHLRSGEQLLALKVIDSDIGNVRAAWRRLATTADVAAIEQCMTGLYAFYDLRGWVKEGEEAFRVAVEQLAARELPAQATRILAQLMARQAGFCIRQLAYDQAQRLLDDSLPVLRGLDARADLAFALGRLSALDVQRGAYESAAQTLHESLALYQALNDKQSVAATLNGIGAAIQGLGQYRAAKDRYQASLNLSREIGDKWGIASAFYRLGHAAYDLGEYPEALQCHEASLSIRRRLDDRWGVAESLNHLGIILDVTGRYAEAASDYEESLAIRRELGDRRGIASSLNNLGQNAFLCEAYADAQQRYGESLEIYREIEDQRGIAISLTCLGEVALARGAYDAARQYHQDSLLIFREIGHAAGMSFALTFLGDVSTAQAAYAEARAYYSEALEIALRTQAAPRALDTLVGAASLLMQTGRREKAIELLSLVLAHPAGEKLTQKKAQQLVGTLIPGLHAANLATSGASKQAFDWEVTVKNLLEEWREATPGLAV